MTFGAFSQYAINEIPAIYDLSTPDPFATLLANPEAQLIYLVELSPFSASAIAETLGMGPFGSAPINALSWDTLGGVLPKYLSDVGYTTATVNYYAQVENPYQFDNSIFSGDDFRSNSPSFGAISILNGDGELDDYESLYWIGQDVVIKAGAEDFAIGEFATIFSGTVGSVEYDDDRITLNIRDKSNRLDAPAVLNLYRGTGGVEGGNDLLNLGKPFVFGEVLNISPILVDSANLIYQIHDGAMQSVDAVRDKGVVLTNGGDVADITVAVVSAGQYKTQLSGGYIKLGSTPAGRITCDVKGDTTGTYTNLVGQITQRILKTQLGDKNFAAAEIDDSAFDLIDLAVTGACGVYVQYGDIVSDILGKLINPLGCFYTFDRAGVITAGVIDSPATPSFYIDDDSIAQDGVQIVGVVSGAYRVNLGYAKNWTIQNADDIAAAATDAVKTFTKEAYRYVLLETLSSIERNPLAVERHYETALVNKTDAETVLARVNRIYANERKIYRVMIYGALFKTFIGDTVNLTYPRYNLSTGKNLIVVGMSEDAEMNLTTLELWG